MIVMANFLEAEVYRGGYCVLSEGSVLDCGEYRQAILEIVCV